MLLCSSLVIAASVVKKMLAIEIAFVIPLFATLAGSIIPFSKLFTTSSVDASYHKSPVSVGKISSFLMPAFSSI